MTTFTITVGRKDRHGEPVPDFDQKLAPMLYDIAQVWGGATVYEVNGYYVALDGKLTVESATRIEVAITGYNREVLNARLWFSDLADELNELFDQESVLLSQREEDHSLRFNTATV